MNITVVGTGYVGLVTGVCFASAGNKVTCVDIDAAKVAALQSAVVPIYEPGLDAIFNEALTAGNLSFTTSLKDAVTDAQIIFLALPTPPDADGRADLSAITVVATQLGPLLTQYVVIVDKSTVPIGTAEMVIEKISAGTSIEFDVISNPEFLKEGIAVEDFMHPDRVVIGSETERPKALLKELYAPFIESEQQLVWMDLRSAEMTKYAANSFLAMKVSFMNEIANLCERVGGNVDAVRLGIGPDKRIGERMLYAGIGFGGSCFPKDVQALQRTSEEYDYDFRLLESIIQVNTTQKQRLVEKMIAYYKTEDLRDKHFAVWGLAFKRDTDDVREAASLEIIKHLLKLGARITAYDPAAIATAKKQLGEQERLNYCDDRYQAAEKADALIIATEWKEFQDVDFSRLHTTMKQPVIFDGRNMLNLQSVGEAGFYYSSIGRPDSVKAS